MKQKPLAISIGKAWAHPAFECTDDMLMDESLNKAMRKFWQEISERKMAQEILSDPSPRYDLRTTATVNYAQEISPEHSTIAATMKLLKEMQFEWENEENKLACLYALSDFSTVANVEIREMFPKTVQDGFQAQKQDTGHVQHAAEILRDDFQLVDVCFEVESGIHTYKADKSLKLITGATVFVIAARQDKMLKLATIVAIKDASEIDLTATFRYKWIVGKGEEIMASYAKNVARDAGIHEVFRKARERQDHDARVGVVTDMIKQNLNAAERRELNLLVRATKAKRRR